MSLDIELRNSNLSQFSDDLWMTARSGDTTITFDVEQDEMLEFALMLVDIADDCLRKYKGEAQEAKDLTYHALEALNEAIRQAKQKGDDQ